ncbi:MAG: sugar porter family MFS transporter [Saprospiraceae bacterium]|nr:sugar porter family MFS transporter [Saprospiraceae bacterium]
MFKDKLSYWSLTVAVAGFLFGFDTVVISGANLPIKELWNTSPWFHGIFIMSMALWGTVIGSMFGGWPTDRLGRKKTLFWIGILFSVSALGSAFAPEMYSFSFFRFIGGLAVGASSVAVPIYISEIAPPEERGRLGIRYQLLLVLGIFIAFISNYLLDGVGGAIDWRLMLGVEAIPALVYTVMVMGVPRSPRWLLLKKKDEAGAREVLAQMGIADIDRAVSELKASEDGFKGNVSISSAYSKPILLAFLIALFNQLSGINFVLYYAPEILERSGLGGSDSLLSSISIGAVNLLFTYMGMFLIDRLGRKQLMLIGSIGYIISLSVVAYGFKTTASPIFLLTFICLFVASHAIGQGAVIWVFISEIFPTRIRAIGQSIGTSTHWVLAAIITLVTPVFLDKENGLFGEDPSPIFMFFAGFMVLQLLFVLFMMPETKGKTLEEIEAELVR